MNNIKVIFRGTKAPSGKTTDIQYMISKERLELLEKSGMFNMEIEKPKASPKKKKASKKEEEGDK